MFKITGKFREPFIDMEKYKKLLQDQLVESLIQATMQWLGAATAIIPVWSGASRATFLSLARAINYSLTISPKVISRISMGSAESEGGLKIDKDTGKFSFFYSTTLEHLVYNEYNNANENPDPGLFARLLQPGPYNFQETARQAFLAEIRNVMLPDPRQVIGTKAVK
jgi:hypothetical protein